MTMLEKIARAISGSGVTSPASLRKARAAVEAMREPTPEMVEAAMGALNRYIDRLPKEVRDKTKEPGGYVLVNHIEKHAIRYRAMVDAILNEKHETK